MRLALTGCIAAGKSLFLQEAQKRGWAVWSADRSVHERCMHNARVQYGLQNVLASIGLFSARQKIDSSILRSALARHPQLLVPIERIIHPFVKKEREKFLSSLKKNVYSCCEIPLLYEAGEARFFDRVICVDSPISIRRKRAVLRGMPGELFDRLDARQLPQRLKRWRADRWICNDTTLRHYLAMVRMALITLERR